MTQFAWSEVLAFAVTLFFIMDPLGNIPVFNVLLKKFSPAQRLRIITRELLTALAVLLFFLFAGTKILHFLGLSQPSLNIAGGILLFIIALRMLYPPRHSGDEQAEEDPFIVPLAIPLIAGPSTIAVLLLMSTSQPDRLYEWTVSLFIAWFLTMLILLSSSVILKCLGDRAVRAMERLMGMLLVLIAVQMFLNGITQYLTEYGLVRTT